MVVEQESEGGSMISITDDAKGLFRQVERPEGTVLRLTR